MLYLLVIAAIFFFITHVALLVASFTGSKFASSRYFYSHLTLWLTGIIIFVLAIAYSGTNQSQFLDYFNTTLRRVMILVATVALSLVAHSIVTLLVLPLIRKNKSF
ncbi:hypothetical protein [Mucilaginibacter sp. SP1R1]|uniref:hypothetical protein n=1 Tax=Mucilaginibacter sp. SP1R1 TaxID=2723091 RepID=UPI00161D9BB0|nr:hypothetical protein [Mucilaginibacter sp. SP1R1]MBB6148010.1 SNF family Na+-dependent transporter [Mucilaginibacter sp. SP1R1]